MQYYKLELNPDLGNQTILKSTIVTIKDWSNTNRKSDQYLGNQTIYKSITVTTRVQQCKLELSPAQDLGNQTIYKSIIARTRVP